MNRRISLWISCGACRPSGPSSTASLPNSHRIWKPAAAQLRQIIIISIRHMPGSQHNADNWTSYSKVFYLVSWCWLFSKTFVIGCRDGGRLQMEFRTRCCINLETTSMSFFGLCPNGFLSKFWGGRPLLILRLGDVSPISDAHWPKSHFHFFIYKTHCSISIIADEISSYPVWNLKLKWKLVETSSKTRKHLPGIR